MGSSGGVQSGGSSSGSRGLLTQVQNALVAPAGRTAATGGANGCGFEGEEHVAHVVAEVAVALFLFSAPFEIVGVALDVVASAFAGTGAGALTPGIVRRRRVWCGRWGRSR
jgi:hypothetical protein